MFLFTASQAQPRAAATFLNVHAGYGTETNSGYYGFFGGVGIERTIKKKFSIEVAASYFSGHGDPLYTNATETYKALFLTPNFSYHLVGNKNSFFQMTLSAGPALKWYKAKELSSMYIHINGDGSETVVEPVTYGIEKGTVLSLYGGIEFTFNISPKVKTALFLDTYSHEILVEHFMPGIKVGVRL